MGGMPFVPTTKMEDAHIFSLGETIGQENHVICVKLRPRVNFRPASGATSKTSIFYKYVVFKHSSSLLPSFFAAATHSL